MKKVKVLNILMIVAISLYCLFTVVNPVLAAHNWSTDLSNIDSAPVDTNLNTSVNKIVGAIIGVMRIVGTGVALIMIIAVAVKYMSAAPGDRADIKKHAVPFVVGAIVLFASSGILSIIQKFANNIK